MRLASAQGLKQQLLTEVVNPFTEGASRVRTRGAAAMASAATAAGGDAPQVFGVGARPFEELPQRHRLVALGVAWHHGEFRLAVRVQRPSLVESPLMDRVTREARGEIDVRIVGRVDKRARARRASARARAAVPWYQKNTRPLLIGASVGHFKVTAGTLGAFASRGGAVHILSNNHVLANEDLASAKDWILQRARFDGGRQPAERVARLSFWVRLKKSRANFVDAALATLEPGFAHDVSRLRDLVGGNNRRLAGLGPEAIDEGESVFKVGRTTGPTAGRVTAFDLDNLVVSYDVGNLRFDNQIEIEGAGRKAFSDGGDSGSLIVNERMEAVALLFAGSDVGGENGLGLTFGKPIHRVLKALKATLLF